MSYNVYVAAPWVRREEAIRAANEIDDAGFNITSRWLLFHGESSDPAVLAVEAQHDLHDVRYSHALVLLNLEQSEGKAVETGIALALRRLGIVVGEPSNIFHHLPGVKCVATVVDAIKLLKGELM